MSLFVGFDAIIYTYLSCYYKTYHIGQLYIDYTGDINMIKP